MRDNLAEVLCICIAVLGIFTLGALFGRFTTLSHDGDMCQLYDGERMVYNKTGTPSGIYYPSEEVYCVYTENRRLNEIQETDYHEMAHHLINKDREHFCD